MQNKDLLDENDRLNAKLNEIAEIKKKDIELYQNDLFKKEEEIKNLKKEIKLNENHVIFYEEFSELNPVIQMIVKNELDNSHLEPNARRYDHGLKMFSFYVFYFA